MKRGTKDAIVTVAAAMAVVAVAFSGLYVYSGVWPPFSIVESGSMQHSDRSSFATIDTGDAVVLRTPDKVDIRTYVDGYKDGYKRFGDYGDVIIYERAGKIPVIHRPVVWLDWNASTNHWEAPSLVGFPAGKWECDNGLNDPMMLSGKLTFIDYGFASQTVHLNLDALPKESGYVTKGDNNPVFDQGSLVTGLVTEERVLFVAGFTVPWAGVLKLYLSGNQDAISKIPPNSVPDMIAMTVAVLALLAAAFLIGDYVSWRRRKGKE